jgi:hypothetical protein
LSPSSESAAIPAAVEAAESTSLFTTKVALLAGFFALPWAGLAGLAAVCAVAAASGALSIAITTRRRSDKGCMGSSWPDEG